MTGQDDQFKQAVAAFKDGRREEARDLLMDIVDKDERHEQAWLYLSALVETVEEQQICLENVLEINPNNDRARKGLEKVKEQIAARAQDELPSANDMSSGLSVPPDISSAASDDSDASPFSTLDWDTMPAPEDEIGAASSQPIGAEFGATSGDALVGDAPAGFPPPDSFSPGGTADNDSLDWLNDESTQPMFSPPGQPAEPSRVPDSDPYASPTSVDWGASDAPATPGSGKNVDMLSSQEYDDWVQNLNIKNDDELAAPEAGTAADALGSPFTADAPGPFSGTDFMLGDETLGDPEMQTPEKTDAASGAFGGDVFGSDTVPAWDSPESGRGRGATAAADSSASFDADSMFDGAPAAVDGADSEFGSGSLFDDDYAAEDDDFGGATVYEPDESLFSADDDEDDLDFSFDEEDDSFLDEEPAKSAGKTKSDKRSKKTKQPKQRKQPKAAPAIDPAHAKYYALIPADIEAQGGSSGRGMVVLGILIMVALNAAGYAAYFLELI